MKQPIITLSCLLCSTIIGLADTETPIAPIPTSKPVQLKPSQQQPSRPRVPAKPIYGEFANQVLYLYLDETSESSYVLTISKDDTTIENATLSSAELVCGYTVSASVPFTVELTTENNVTYVGEVSE